MAFWFKLLQKGALRTRWFSHESKHPNLALIDGVEFDVLVDVRVADELIVARLECRSKLNIFTEQITTCLR
jgi:hypothetical protein